MEATHDQLNEPTKIQYCEQEHLQDTLPYLKLSLFSLMIILSINELLSYVYVASYICMYLELSFGI